MERHSGTIKNNRWYVTLLLIDGILTIGKFHIYTYITIYIICFKYIYIYTYIYIKHIYIYIYIWNIYIYIYIYIFEFETKLERFLCWEKWHNYVCKNKKYSHKKKKEK